MRLLDIGYFRIGNDVYADENGSFGLTTLERRHVRKRQDRLVFTLVGKSGVEHEIEIDDHDVVEAIEIMRRRRGPDLRLLSYKDGRWWRSILPELVNTYVRDSTGLEATARDFRRDERGSLLPRQHRHARPVVVRRSSRHRGVRARRHHRRATSRTYDSPDSRHAAPERATLRLIKEV